MKKILLVCRNDSSDREEMQKLQKKLFSEGNIVITVTTEVSALYMATKWKANLIICLADCGEIDERWRPIQRIYEEIKKILFPDQKLIRLGYTLQEGCKDLYLRLPFEDGQLKRILTY